MYIKNAFGKLQYPKSDHDAAKIDASIPTSQSCKAHRSFQCSLESLDNPHVHNVLGQAVINANKSKDRPPECGSVTVPCAKSSNCLLWHRSPRRVRWPCGTPLSKGNICAMSAGAKPNARRCNAPKAAIWRRTTNGAKKCRSMASCSDKASARKSRH